MTLKKNEAVFIYCNPSEARKFVDYMLDEIEDSFISDDFDPWLLFCEDGPVIITLAANGEIFIEEAYGIEHVKEPGDGVCYISEKLPFDDIYHLMTIGNDWLTVFAIKGLEQ